MFASVYLINLTATARIYALSLHDALPIFQSLLGGRAHGGLFDVLLERVDGQRAHRLAPPLRGVLELLVLGVGELRVRSEEHTSELQSRGQIVCCLLLGKKSIR